MFTGTVRIKICEASGLRPTDFQKRLNMTFGKPSDEQPIDPYVTVDVDETHVAQTTTKQKTFDPVWNEYFEHTVENAKTLTLTVFHDAAIPPDDFVANCSIPFEDLLVKENEECDFWVSVCVILHRIHHSVGDEDGVRRDVCHSPPPAPGRFSFPPVCAVNLFPP